MFAIAVVFLSTFNLAFAAHSFENHLQEAIALNLERKPLYSALTEGKAEKISNSLIRMEKLLLGVARRFDSYGDYYQRNGVPFLSEEFVSMSQTPAFDSLIKPAESRPQELEGYSGLKLTFRVLQALSSEGLQGAMHQSERELEDLSYYPSFFCMTRHMLESTYRIAYFGILHDRQARELGLPSPLSYSKNLIRVHALGFLLGLRLDRKAAPIQEKGIPILCQDVPPLQIH